MIILLPGLLMLAGLWHYFFRFPGINAHPLEAASITAPLIIRLDHWALSATPDTSAQPAWIRLLPSAFEEAHTDLEAIKTALLKSNYPKPAVDDVYWIVQNPERSAPTALVVINLSGLGYSDQQLLNRFSYHSSSFKGRPIHALDIGKGQRLAMARYRNLLLIARQALLVEEAISQLDKPYANVMRQSAFRQVNKSLPKGAWCSAYLNTAFLHDEVKGWLTPQAEKAGKALGRQIAWCRLDLSPSRQGITIDGWLAPEAPNALLAKKGWEVQPSSQALWRVLPGHTAAFTRLSVSDWSAYGQQMGRFLKRWAGKEAAVVVTEPVDGNPQRHRFLVVEGRDKENMPAQINAMFEAAGQINTYEYQTFIVRQLRSDYLFDSWCTPGQKDCFRHPWVAILDRYAIFAADRASLEVWIDAYLAGNVLATDEPFLQLFQLAKAPSAGTFYCNADFLLPLVKAFSYEESVRNLSASMGRTYINMLPQSGSIRLKGWWRPQSAPQQQYGSTVVWKAIMPAPVVGSPQIVALEAGQYRIAVQDTSDMLYWLNADGRTLWKYPLDGPLLSKIHAVKPAKAITHQLVMNTAKTVYVIDTEGKDVEPFPFALQSPATNGLTVADFDLSQTYSYFIACANGNIYGYDLTGRPIEGWNPLSGMGNVPFDIGHFQEKDKDFYIVLNASGQLKVLRKDGANRFSPLSVGNQIAASPVFQVLPDSSRWSSSGRIVVVNQSGAATVVNTSGQTFNLRLAPPGKGPVSFAFGNWLGDERNDYASLYDSTLAVYAYDGPRFYKHALGNVPPGIDEAFSVRLPDSNRDAIGAVSRTRRLIYLFDGEAKMVNGFPLAGNSTFQMADLFDNGQAILIVAADESVYAYRIK